MRFIIILFLLLNQSLLFSDNNYKKMDDFPIDLKNKIMGVWENESKQIDNDEKYIPENIFKIPYVFYVKNYSWGISFYRINSSLEIDINKNNKLYICDLTVEGEFEKYKMISKNIYEFEMKFKDDIFYILIELLDNNKMLLENKYKIDGLNYIDKLLLYKIGGPYIKYLGFFKPKINNLRLREKPTLESKTIKILKINDKLEYIDKHFDQGKYVIIDGIKGYWFKVRTEDNIIGFCFGGYLDFY